MFVLKGKTAIVTGGTRGIGFSIVKTFLDNGANVALLGSRQNSVESTLSKLSQYKDRVIGLWPDLMNPEEVKRDFEKVKNRFGSVDILANNAGLKPL